MNQVTLLGRLVRDFDVKTFDSGSVTRGSVVVNRYWKDKNGEKQEESTFVDVEIWNKLGENASNILSKGDRVLITGSLKQENWEASDGSKRSKLLVKVANFQKLDYTKDDTKETKSSTPSKAKGKKEPELAGVGTESEDLPF